MEILENREEWQEIYRQGWLAKLQAEGVKDWRLYQHPRNEQAPGVPGVKLSHSRLLFITSAGAYLPDRQRPFDVANLTGDYTMRTFPSATPLADLAYAHDHYDHTMVDRDPQVALPLRHLEDLVNIGQRAETVSPGELAPSVISFMGYQPNAGRVIDELIPPIIAAAQTEGVQAALLAPV